MPFGERMRARRGELDMTRVELAALLGVSPSAVGNYETGVSFPKEEIMLRLFDALEVDPNTLFQDSFQYNKQALASGEQKLLEGYRGLSALGRETVRTMVEALCAYRDEAEAGTLLEDARRSISRPSSQALRTHGKRGKDDVRQLLW